MISSVYSYYLSQYGHRTNSKYDTHTKSQLKNTYSKVVKINSQTPVYKLDLSSAAQKYKGKCACPREYNTGFI